MHLMGLSRQVKLYRSLQKYLTIVDCTCGAYIAGNAQVTEVIRDRIASDRHAVVLNGLGA